MSLISFFWIFNYISLLDQGLSMHFSLKYIPQIVTYLVIPKGIDLYLNKIAAIRSYNKDNDTLKKAKRTISSTMPFKKFPSIKE